MYSKTIIAFSVQLLLVKIVFSQYLGPAPAEHGNLVLPEGSLPAAITANLAGIVPERASNGGSFRVQSSSPIAPSGITVLAENLLIDGKLAVTGNLPFMGAVSVDGALPAVGQGAVVYNCGNGNVGIVKEGIPEIISTAPIVGAGNTMGIPTNTRLPLGKYGVA